MRPEDVSPNAVAVCRRLSGAGHAAYVVGGCVRDLQMGRLAKDWDVATSAHPEEVQKLFPRTIPTGIAHGTITVMSGPGAPKPIEVTTFRGEGAYSDARRPDFVTFGVSLEEDLARRDFTMNAMAFDPIHDQLADPFGGAADLMAKRIRAVGDPLARFTEDGLRVMRAVRFAATLGFAIDAATEGAITGALPSLARVSAERVSAELGKLLGAERPSVGLEVAERAGVLRLILPELSILRAGRVDATPAPEGGEARPGPPAEGRSPQIDVVPRTAALLLDLTPEAADGLLRRLKLSNADRERAVAIIRYAPVYETRMSDAQLRRFLGQTGAALVRDLVAVRTADGREDDLGARAERILAARQPLTIGDLAVNGADVMRVLDVRGGKIVGETLRALLDRVLEDPSLNERDRLLALIGEARP